MSWTPQHKYLYKWLGDPNKGCIIFYHIIFPYELDVGNVSTPFNENYFHAYLQDCLWPYELVSEFTVYFTSVFISGHIMVCLRTSTIQRVEITVKGQSVVYVYSGTHYIS